MTAEEEERAAERLRKERVQHLKAIGRLTARLKELAEIKPRVDRHEGTIDENTAVHWLIDDVRNQLDELRTAIDAVIPGSATIREWNERDAEVRAIFSNRKGTRRC